MKEGYHLLFSKKTVRIQQSPRPSFQKQQFSAVENVFLFYFQEFHERNTDHLNIHLWPFLGSGHQFS